MGYIFSYAIVWGRVDADRARAARVQLRVSVGHTIFSVTVYPATDQVANQDVLRLE